ncbi:MlaD family protein [[Mycobacterium] burgundiense]|uniref:MlaD family protein n=1 Tax=[Mycobacterium] burgundiense TaxID=3064286 RepID=A0ABM9LKA1_9MYCO|nr:MlaD family protein [Mycolicibacterium sp. MU0053]CAJ1500515.1 MlaD family protein [Mycolicibacterium sp. MU0053]
MMKPSAALWRLALSAGVAVVLLIMLANILIKPVATHTRTYVAEFTDASGLHEDGDVRVRGVRVGKVESIELERRDGQNVAAVRLTLDTRYGVVPITRIAIKYQALTGVRYLDVLNSAEGYAENDLVTRVPTSMTQPSFDITALFNGLQPVLATLSPDEIDIFTANAASFLSGDGNGLGPLLESFHKLTEFVSDRQEVVATLMRNLKDVADAIDGKSRELIDLIDLVEQPIDSILAVRDEFRKAWLYGDAFFAPTVRLLHNAGLQPGINVDQALDRAFSNLDNFFEAIELVPVMYENVPPPGREGEPEPCTRGPAQLPETMDVLLNGTRVVLCNR